MPSFFDTDAGKGLVQFGTTLLNDRRNKRDQDERLRKTQGPLYDQQIGLAGTALKNAGNMDPRQMAQERFNQLQDLTAEGDRAAEEALMRRLVAQGQSGVASHGGVAGTKQTPGQPINPQLAALYAAREGAKNRAAYDSMQEAEKFIDTQVSRAGMLNNQANNTVTARSAPEVQRVIAPRQPSTSDRLLQLGTGLLTSPGGLSTLTSGIGQIGNALGGLFGGGDGGGWESDLDFGWLGGGEQFGDTGFYADFGFDDWNF